MFKDTDTHLQSLKYEVDSVINEAIQKDLDKEKEDTARIKHEIDEKNQKLHTEIQKINEKIRQNDEERGKRLELNRANAERRRESIDNKQHGLQTDIDKKKLKRKKEKLVSWRNLGKMTQKPQNTDT